MSVAWASAGFLCIPCRLKASPCAGTLVIWTERIFPAQKNLFLGPYCWFIFYIWLISEFHTRPDVLPGPFELFWTPIANQSEHRFLMIDHIDFYVWFWRKYLKKYYPRYLFCTTTQEISHKTYIRFLFSTSYLGLFLSFNHCVILSRLFLMKFFLAMRA